MSIRSSSRFFALLSALSVVGTFVILFSGYLTIQTMSPCLLPWNANQVDCLCSEGQEVKELAGQKRLRAGAQASCRKIVQADYEREKLDGVNLEGSHVVSGNFEDASIVAGNMRGALLSRTNFTGADLRTVDATLGDFRGATFIEANLSAANFLGADLSYTELDDAKLINTNLSGANLRSARLINVIAERAQFANTDMRDSELEGGNFRYSNFAYANLQGADLRQAKFTHVQISGTKFDDVVDIPQYVLHSAWAWSDSLPDGLPEHLTILVCDAKFRDKYNDAKQTGLPKTTCRRLPPRNAQDNSIAVHADRKNRWKNGGKLFGSGGSDRPLNATGPYQR